VPGGELAVEAYRGTTEPVLAIHGISSTRMLWSWLREELPELTLLAPDLRGRGDSVDVGGPSSIVQHADDMVAILDARDLESVHVCGMSMGGFVGVALAVRHPERVRSLTLVDGGFPMPTPPGLTVDNVHTALADRYARLGVEWDSVEAYRDFFVANTAPLLDPGDPLLLDYLRHDLSRGRARLSAEVLTQDAADVFFGEEYWRKLAVPTRLLAAEWSSGEGTPAAYSDEQLAEWEPLLQERRRVEKVDHAAIIMSPHGAAAVADVLRRSLGTA
jgi:pimeloyl-ACP methyl ester carboxylesterase